VIVRWGLAELPGVLDELSISRPLLISTERWRHLQLPVHGRFHGVRAHAEIAGVTAAREAAGGADGLIALGGGSAIETAKAISSETGLPVVSIPTTYSGAEWTSSYGMRDASIPTRLGGGGAQELGGRYGLPQGTMNAVSLPAVLRFNSTAAAGELARFGEAIDRGGPVARVSELAALAGPSRLRDYEVPREDLPELAQGIAERPAAKANPRPAPPDVVLELLEELW
jgi:alcohol dehydrogenase class IV